MRWARPSTTAVLPTPGSPTSTGLFFVRRERICMIRSISVSRPTHGPEQDVLGADVVVPQRQRLAEGELEHLLRPRREGDLAGGDLLAGADDADDLRSHALDGDVEALEHPRRQALLLAEQAEQDVL